MANGARRSACRTVLVTGAAGFLGSHLCDLLIADGHRLIGIDNLQTGALENLAGLERESRFSLIETDITQELPAGLRIDRIINLACAASPPHYQDDPVHTMLTSVVGINNLLALARDCGARVLQSSTSEVYGDPEQHPQSEEYWGHVNPIGVRACYDEGKRAAETLCFDYRRRHGVDVRVARIFNTYGPRMRPDDGRIVSNLVIQALLGQPLTIYGDGRQTRSFCYVSDLIDGLSRLIEIARAPDMPINLGNPEEYTVKELAALVLDLSGSRSRMIHRPLPPDDPHCRRPDISRARALLDWRPTVSVRQGLLRTIEWFESIVKRRPSPIAKETAAFFAPVEARAAPEAR